MWLTTAPGRKRVEVGGGREERLEEKERRRSLMWPVQMGE
jgi:hypothetical protein